MSFNSGQWNGGSGGSGVAAPITASKLIYGALRLIGVLRTGQGASVESIDDCHVALNDQVELWNIERLMIPSLTRTIYDLEPGQSEYDLQEDSGSRPIRIEYASYVSSGSADETPIPVSLMNESVSGYEGVYVDNGFPLATLRLNPAPSDSSQKLAIYSWQRLSRFEDLDTEYSIPSAYALALRFGLAVQIAPQFVMHMKTSNVMMQSIERQAVQFKAQIKIANVPQQILRVDEALLCDPFFSAGW